MQARNSLYLLRFFTLPLLRFSFLSLAVSFSALFSLFFSYFSALFLSVFFLPSLGH
jgi:hypothetical protein